MCWALLHYPPNLNRKDIEDSRAKELHIFNELHGNLQGQLKIHKGKKGESVYSFIL